MDRRILSFILTIQALLLTVSCEQELSPSNEDDVQQGDLVFVIGTSHKTKAVEDAGDAIHDLAFWILDSSNNVVECGDSYSATPFEGLDIASDALSATLHITNIKRGDYKLYMAANIPSTLKTSFTSITKGSAVTDSFFKAVLPAVRTSLVPPYGDGYTDNYMPLSLVKDIAVYAGRNTISAELVRCCARVRIEVINSTQDFNVFLTDVALSDSNPDRGYLFSNGHSVPSGTAMLPFRDYSVSGATGVFIAPGESKVYMDQYLYETGSDSMTALNMMLTGGLFQTSTSEVEKKTLTKTIYSYGESAQYPTSTSASYLIRSAASSYYLKANGTLLIERIRPNKDLLMLDSDMPDYLWSFSSTSSSAYTTVQNVGTSKYIDISSSAVTLGDDSKSIYMSSGNVSSSMSLSYYKSRYYMTGANTDGASLTVSSSQSDYNSWIVIPVTATTSTGSFLVDTSDNSVAVKDIAESITGLTFIDDRGQAQTLTEICRNDDLHIKVYVHYTPSSAVLYFQVKAWNNVNNETTFD